MTDILKDELVNDPLTRGYSGMTDEAAATDLNTAYRDDPNPPTSIPAAALWNAFDLTEYDALGAGDKAVADFIGDLGSDLPISAGLIKNKIFGMFGAGTTSRANIIALTAVPQITRAVELGLSKVKVGHVMVARAI